MRPLRPKAASAKAGPLGVSDAYTDKVTGENDKSRNLLGFDLTYRYTPLSEAAGGSKTVKPDLEALAEAFRASAARAACICSSDALYAEYGEAAAGALKAAGARYVVLAGRPGDDQDHRDQVGELLLGPPALGDVAVDPEIARDLALRVADHDIRRLDPDLGSILPLDGDLTAPAALI